MKTNLMFAKEPEFREGIWELVNQGKFWGKGGALRLAHERVRVFRSLGNPPRETLAEAICDLAKIYYFASQNLAAQARQATFPMGRRVWAMRYFFKAFFISWGLMREVGVGKASEEHRALMVLLFVKLRMFKHSRRYYEHLPKRLRATSDIGVFTKIARSQQMIADQDFSAAAWIFFSINSTIIENTGDFSLPTQAYVYFWGAKLDRLLLEKGKDSLRKNSQSQLWFGKGWAIASDNELSHYELLFESLG